jgi:hypothetical protein
MNQQYLDESARLRDHDDYCQHLINLIDDEAQELDMSSDRAIITKAVITLLSDVLNRRIQAVDHLIEADANKTMDRFRRKEIR